ncbi:hypothetical protein LTR28_004643 [Elasticomyces elasticus]|nr:hypothetical protein LTR28_004643 [Elasticomyces elasticus]
MAGQALQTDAEYLFSHSAIDLMGIRHKSDRSTCSSVTSRLKDIKFAKHGKAHEMVRKGDITYGGEMVINPSSGLTV